jgi:hypothetical protein
MSCSKPTSGRKRESPIWEHFTYDAAADKCTCIISNSDGKTCGRLLTGKNSTNLVTHLRTFHKETFKAYSQKKDDLKITKSAPPGSVDVYECKL